jgi:hypothetical protein
VAFTRRPVGPNPPPARIDSPFPKGPKLCIILFFSQPSSSLLAEEARGAALHFHCLPQFGPLFGYFYLRAYPNELPTAGEHTFC